MVMAVAAALQGAFWAYDGWIKASYIAGEIRNAQHVLPRATVYGMLAVTALYLLMNLGYCWVLPIDEMAESKLVAADITQWCSPARGCISRWRSATFSRRSLAARTRASIRRARP
jgi:APA family basic amino acid/polyamine antiporter